ncbi:MAG: hypothetical protein H6Q75_1637 [Firmicutes bacterium]|nr:hypothetical protein [Bacillota bacterium]
MLKQINDFIVTLRRNDTISSSLFARKTGLTVEFAKRVLGELVAQGIMEYYIIVPCSNPLEDAEHYVVFSSLEDLNSFSVEETCTVCDQCGHKFDAINAKFGYRRHDKDKK